MIDMGKFT